MDKKSVFAAALAASAATAGASPIVDARPTIASGPKSAASAPAHVECKVNPDTGRHSMTVPPALKGATLTEMAKATPCVTTKTPALELKK